MLFQKHRVGSFYKNIVAALQSVYGSSHQESLNLDIGIYENHDGIYIMTDARNGWRKNAKDVSIVSIENISHKALQCIYIIKLMKWFLKAINI